MSDLTMSMFATQADYWKIRAERAEAALATARRDALEEAAKVCEERIVLDDEPDNFIVAKLNEEDRICAATIRALAAQDQRGAANSESKDIEKGSCITTQSAPHQSSPPQLPKQNTVGPSEVDQRTAAGGDRRITNRRDDYGDNWLYWNYSISNRRHGDRRTSKSSPPQVPNGITGLEHSGRPAAGGGHGFDRTASHCEGRYVDTAGGDTTKGGDVNNESLRVEAALKREGTDVTQGAAHPDNTPTPLTDAEALRFARIMVEYPPYTTKLSDFRPKVTELIPADFARRLERCAAQMAEALERTTGMMDERWYRELLTNSKHPVNEALAAGRELTRG